MKDITLNVNLVQIPTSLQTEEVWPCPRINFFTNTEAFSAILAPGSYSETYSVSDDGFAGVDIFAWQDNIVDVSTTASMKIKVTGEFKDQTQTTVVAASAGTYNIDINIE